MNVLFLCQRVPYPPDRGDRITTWHFLAHLLARGAEVRLGCFSGEARDDDAVAFLRDRCREVEAPRLDRLDRNWRCFKGLLRGQPLTLPYFSHPALTAAVDRWYSQQQPDLVYVYSSSMAQYVLHRPGPVRVMQFAELDSDKWLQFSRRGNPLQRWFYRREARLLLAFESEVARAFDVSFVVSEVEKQLFVERIPGVVPVVLPNGVDVEHFRSAGDAARHPHGLVFTGVMDYRPNVDGVLWFARECWPALRQRFADAQLSIVGSRPTKAVQQLAALPGITVTGRVPETVPWFDRASVAIAPLRLARGVQNKVLEAMCMDLPVVASPQAAQGLGDVPPGALAVCDDPAAMIERIGALFADPTRARAMGRQAGDWVRAHFRWQHMFAILDRVLAAKGLA